MTKPNVPYGPWNIHKLTIRQINALYYICRYQDAEFTYKTVQKELPFLISNGFVHADKVNKREVSQNDKYTPKGLYAYRCICGVSVAEAHGEEFKLPEGEPA